MIVPAHVLAAIRQPAFVYRREGIVEAANDRAEALAGGPLAGMTPADILACLSIRRRDGTPLLPNDLPVVRALRGEEVIDVPLTVTTADGRTVHVLATASPVRNSDAVTGALSVWQDVTALVEVEERERRQREEVQAQSEELRVQQEELQCQTDELREQGDALRTSLERLAFAQRVARTGFWDWDMRTDQLAWSPGFYDLFGLDHAAPASFGTWLGVLHPDDREEAMATIDRSVRERTPLENEYRIVLPDGEARWIAAYGDTTYDPGDRPVRMAGICVDITERKRAEEDEARLHTLMDHNPCLVFLKDEEGRYVYLNETYERQFVHRKDWQGKTDFDFWPAKSAELFRANDAEVLASGRTHQYLEDSTDLDGTRYVWFNYKFPFIDAQGRRYVGGVGIDATARVRAEEALAESEAEYRHIVEYAPTGIYELDYAGPSFRRVNDAMCEILGYSRDELLAMDPSELMDDEGRERFRERIRAVLAGEPVDETVAFRIFTRDGKEIWAELNVKPTFTDGVMTGALVVAHDITERKRAEEALLAASSALERAHDLLSGIIDDTTDLIAAVDTDFRYLALNEAYRRECRAIYGVDLHVGDSMIEMLARCPEDQQNAIEAFRPAFEGRSVVTTQAYGDPGKSRRIYELHLSPIRDAQGRIIGAAHINTEITERTRAEEALKESEARATAERTRLEGILETAPVGIAIAEAPSGRFLYANDELWSMYRLEPKAVPSTEDYVTFRLFHEDGRPYAPDDYPMARAARGDVVRGLVSSIVRGDGARGSITTNAAPIRDPSGEIVAVIGASTDITEQKHAEEALRESEEQFRRAIEDAPIPIIMHAEDGQVLQLSRTWTELTGYGPEDMPTFDAWLTRAYGEGADAVRDHVQALFSGDARTIDIEFPVRTRGGEQRYWSFSASSPGTLADGRRYVVGMAVDITARKRAETALHESEEWFRSIYEESAVGIELYNADGRLLDVNKAAKAIFGVEDAGVLNGFDLFADPNVTDEVKHRITQGGTVHYQGVFDFDTVRRMNLYPTAKVGSIQIDVTIVPLHRDTGGQISGYLVQVQDITERVRAEEDVQQYTESLRRSNEDLQRFAYVASHDLQEPLRSVISFSQLLERRYRGQLGTDADEYIDFIVEGGNRMQGLILDLLAFSRVNTTRQQITQTDVEDVFAEAVRSLEVSLREAEATLTHDPLPVVMADPTQLAQVFANLVSNAVKFRKPDVPLQIHVGARRLDGFWEFSVSDNGIGIEPEYFEKIFVIFQRLHTKETYPGTGIGLAIVKRIIERHGGRIWVESVPGEGSTFFFTVPAA